MVGAELPDHFIERSENRLARQQRYHINSLLSQLFSSNFTDGAVEIARLCLLWKGYKHPAAEDVMDRLISIGSGQDLFQSLSAAEYLKPVKVNPNIGFAEDDGQAKLADKLGLLKLQDGGLSSSATDEEIATLLRHRKELSKQTRELRAAVLTAAELSVAVALAISLQATTCSSHNSSLLKSIAEFARDQYTLLEAIAGLVGAVRPMLLGDTGLIRNEEQPHRAIGHRPDIGDILDGISADIELVVQLTTSFVLQFAGLMAQGRVLYQSLALDDDEIADILMSPPFESGDFVQMLSCELVMIQLLCDQQDHAEPLIEIEHSVPTIPTPDRGLREVYRKAREIRLKRLKEGANSSFENLFPESFDFTELQRGTQ